VHQVERKSKAVGHAYFTFSFDRGHQAMLRLVFKERGVQVIASLSLGKLMQCDQGFEIFAIGSACRVITRSWLKMSFLLLKFGSVTWRYAHDVRAGEAVMRDLILRCRFPRNRLPVLLMISIN
jgi:hypothetical protein